MPLRIASWIFGFAVTGEIFGSWLVCSVNRFGEALVATWSLELDLTLVACCAERSSAISLVPRWMFSSCVGACMLRRTTSWKAGLVPQYLGLTASVILSLVVNDFRM